MRIIDKLLNKDVYFLVIVISIVMSSCFNQTSDDGVQEAKSEKGQINVTQVKTIIALRRKLEYEIKTSGKIESMREVQTQTKIPGVISRIFHGNGDFVKKGEIVIQMDDTKYKLNLEKAKALLEEKKIEFETQILGFKSLDKERLTLIRNNVRHSSGLAAAEASYNLAKLEFDGVTIRTPIGGTISDLLIKEGNPVRIDEVVFLTHDPSSLIVSCGVLESDVFSLAIGQKATVGYPFDETMSLTAVVSSINPRVNLKTGLINIQLTLDQSLKLLPGMNVVIKIKVPKKTGIVVPKEAIVIRSGKKVIFTLEDGFAKWNYVKTGSETGKEVEIVTGIDENQHVIISNNLQLAQNTPVKNYP